MIKKLAIFITAIVIATATATSVVAADLFSNHNVSVGAKGGMTLSKVKDEQLMILEASEAKGIAEAVPVALARLEYKLANVGE